MGQPVYFELAQKYKTNLKNFTSPLHLTLHPYKQPNITILPFLLFDFTPTFSQSYKQEK
jgi:hypothetical protein